MFTKYEAYAAQRDRWPATGRHILAHFDDDSIVVYQAYRPSIAAAAVEHQRFERGGFSFSRMSWIKPNFLWMMYRSGWASKEGQERVLAVRMRRALFDEMVAGAVHSSFVSEVYESTAAWKEAVATSEVRLQWDPDHAPGGEPQERRAIQLGLRGRMLARYAKSPLAIEDITAFVHEQHAIAREGDWDALRLPYEEVYPVSDAAVASKLGTGALANAGLLAELNVQINRSPNS